MSGIPAMIMIAVLLSAFVSAQPAGTPTWAAKNPPKFGDYTDPQTGSLGAAGKVPALQTFRRMTRWHGLPPIVPQLAAGRPRKTMACPTFKKRFAYRLKPG